MYWKARQAAIGLDFKGDVLHPHEVRSVERLLAAGESLEWIGANKSAPSHDFRWLSNDGLLVEMKSPETTSTNVHRRIEEAVRKASVHPWSPIVKEHFVVDIGNDQLSNRLHDLLAGYNVGRRLYRIKRAWVISLGRLEEIHLWE